MRGYAASLHIHTRVLLHATAARNSDRGGSAEGFDWDQHERLLFKTMKKCNNKQGPVVVNSPTSCASALLPRQLPVQAHRRRHTGAGTPVPGCGAVAVAARSESGREPGVPRLVAGSAAAVRVVQCSCCACGADTEAESSFAHGGHN